MKAIILAAGMGKRLQKYAFGVPKCMLKFLGRPLIEWQVDALRKGGVNEIVIVRGFAAEKISVPGAEYAENREYATTNMAASLMCAKSHLLSSPDGVLVCYADILYEPRLVEAMASFNGDAGVLVDDDWLPYWRARLANWQDDVESLKYDSTGNITSLGKATHDLADARSRYVGMIRFSSGGIRKFIDVFERNRALYWDNDAPWMNSKSFRQAYMTCMLQALINDGVKVKAVHTRRGWLEFDTDEDYEKVSAWARDGSIGRFINLDAVKKS